MTSVPGIPEGLSKCRHAGVLVEVWKNKLRMVSAEEQTEIVEDKIYVNGIEVLGIEKLPDQTTLVIGIDDFLFDHHQIVQDAWKTLKRAS